MTSPGRWPTDGLPAADILLRGWQRADLTQMLALLSEPDVRRWSPVSTPPDEADCRERIDQAIRAQQAGQPHSFAVVDAARPQHVLGSIDWRNTFQHAEFSCLDLGYAVTPQARGRGVASTALAALAGWLLDPAGGDWLRVQLDHAVQNKGSCRTALRAGFGIEGRRDRFLPLREHPAAPLVHHDVCLHGRVRDRSPGQDRPGEVTPAAGPAGPGTPGDAR